MGVFFLLGTGFERDKPARNFTRYFCIFLDDRLLDEASTLFHAI